MKRLFSANAFGPLGESLFFSIWIASFISNIGTWMQNVGVGWVAAAMSASPLIIALIQTASSLPALLFSYPAGVISDHSDRRRLLIGLQLFLFLVTLTLSVLTQLQLLDIHVLIFFTFLIGIGTSLTTPVWQAITPEVVSKNRMKEAIALNGVSFNLARAIGPALGGLVLVTGGIKSIFLFNAISFLALIIGLYRWKNTPSTAKSIEFRKTAIEGLRAVRQAKPFLHLLIRTVSFTAFISVLFAFLPRLSKYEWHQKSTEYTWLWVSLGLGALAGSYLYSIWNKRLTAARIILISCEMVAASLFLLSLTADFYLLNVIMFIAGIGWINATSMLNVLAQQHSPNDFKGRFLAVNVTVFQGSLALSSILWGSLSGVFSTLQVLKVAALFMSIFCGVLALVPMEEAERVKEHSIACTDPLLQYQLKSPE